MVFGKKKDQKKDNSVINVDDEIEKKRKELEELMADKRREEEIDKQIAAENKKLEEKNEPIKTMFIQEAALSKKSDDTKKLVSYIEETNNILNSQISLVNDLIQYNIKILEGISVINDNIIATHQTIKENV